jgi:hypothetical protein
MTFSRGDRIKFDRIMTETLPGVVPLGFNVVSEMPARPPAGISIMRGTLDDGRELAWIKPENKYFITSA